MTSPRRYLVRMLIFITIAGALVGMLYAPLYDAFMANVAPKDGKTIAMIAPGNNAIPLVRKVATSAIFARVIW